jgi:hypothetical protein
MRPCQPGNVFQHVDPQFREFVAAVAAADIAAAKNQLTAAIQNRVADGPAKARQGSRETNRTIPPHFWIRKANGGSIPSAARVALQGKEKPPRDVDLSSHAQLLRRGRVICRLHRTVATAYGLARLACCADMERHKESDAERK